MIYTITANPAIDCLMRLPVLRQGEVQRAAQQEFTFAGKGINVSRMLCALGCESTALLLTAGDTGSWFEQALRQEGLPAMCFSGAAGRTRINVKLRGAEETDINAPGPSADPAAVQALTAQVQTLQSGDTLVLSGSFPPDLSPEIGAQWLASGRQAGTFCVADVAGEGLRQALRAAPQLIKPNAQELEEICGERIRTPQNALRGARQLQQAGAENVLVSLGAQGAVYVPQAGIPLFCAPPQGTALDTTGAGDCLLAGFLAARLNGAAAPEALRQAVAAGSARAFFGANVTAEQVRSLQKKAPEATIICAESS